MEPPSPRWLRSDDGVAVRIDAAVVLSVPGPSTAHSVSVVPHAAGVEVVVTGGGSAAHRHFVGVGETLEIGGRRFELLDGPPAATEPQPGELALPHRLELRPRGRGAELLAWVGRDEPAVVPLTALRGRLMHALCAAWPHGLPDERLIVEVWPRSGDRTRLDVNQLVHRVRGDLRRAGIDGRVVRRSLAGGYTELALPPDGAAHTTG